MPGYPCCLPVRSRPDELPTSSPIGWPDSWRGVAWLSVRPHNIDEQIQPCQEEHKMSEPSQSQSSTPAQPPSEPAPPLEPPADISWATFETVTRSESPGDIETR
jgi:hypothetical protein